MIIPAVIFVVFFLGIYGAHWFFVVRPEELAQLVAVASPLQEELVIG